MTSEYGHKLDPHRKLHKQKGIKDIRRTQFYTHNPSTIDQTGILAVRFPNLGKEDVIVLLSYHSRYNLILITMLIEQ